MPADLEAIRRIQDTSPESSVWAVAGYLSYDCLVAEVAGEVAGFLVLRRTHPEETEILNLAVDPAERRRGIASALLREALRRHSGVFYLEVRESNAAARALYRRCGFREAGVRPKYYEHPSEDGVVMRWQSC